MPRRGLVRIAPWTAWPFMAVLCVAIALANGPAAPAASPEKAVDFARAVKPILSNHCFKCHGPDAAQRQSGLRLDVREAALAGGDSGSPAIVPGKPAESELVRRIDSTDAAELMPPPKSQHVLTPADKEVLRRWVAEGAPYRLHWSFEKLARPALPSVKRGDWARTPIDRFVLARLEAAGAQPSAEAAPATLLRRLSLDLIGLPPSPSEVERFLADREGGAYERLVDRLLASPQYGEKMAQQWLDLARFGDTNGYQDDGYRSMWPYRDWVIEAFNRNLPFDRFTVEQLAGDLLPSATLDQRIASGFNRNHRYNEEGGADPDEFLVAYAVDRVNTTAAVWLGLTFGCAQCHDHKYDPVSQREYYQLYAFFNSLDGEVGVSKAISPPLVKVATATQRRTLDELTQGIAGLERERNASAPKIEAAIARWEAKGARAELPPSLATGLAAHYRLNDAAGAQILDSSGHTRHVKLTGAAPEWVADRRGRAPRFDGALSQIDLGQTADFERNQQFSLACWFNFDRPLGAMLAKMDEQTAERGYEVSITKDGRVSVRVVHAWPDDALRVVSQRRFLAGTWHHLTVTYDGSSSAGGLKLYVDGKVEPVDIARDHLTSSIAVSAPLVLGRRGGATSAAGGSAATPAGASLAGDSVAFRGALDDLRIYQRLLSAAEAATLHTTLVVERALGSPAAERTTAEIEQLRNYFVARFDPLEQRRAIELNKLRAERDTADRALPTTLVMAEMPKPRPAHVLVRGDFEHPADAVVRDVPAVFPPLPADAPRNRLGLARWLVSTEHPLTARVAANRLWKQFFGTGLVRTPDDFGAQGELPTHPELLDWLASEYLSRGWDTKAIIKQMVLSAVYRQSSAVRADLATADPQNRLLARAARFRLTAEEIRDCTLSAAGLLSTKRGGPSVFPPQPASYFADKSGDWHWIESGGEDRYRRGLYTFWRRTTPYPSFQAFDAPSRELCTADRPRTNTPLQALVTLNDPAYFDAAQGLADRVLREGGATTEERLKYAFRLCVARTPAAAETAVLERHYRRQRERYQQHPELAAKFAVGGKPTTGAETLERAAWTAVAAVVLNLDETMTRE